MSKKRKSTYSSLSKTKSKSKVRNLKTADIERNIRKTYEAMGEINWDVNHLEMFTPTLMHDLWMIFKSTLNNHEKANALDLLLEPMGFYELGLGTNVCTFIHENYDGVVFKIALDRCGLADNRNDPYLPETAPEANPPVVVDMTPDALVSVQEYVYAINDADLMRQYWSEALAICESLSKRFIVIDVTPMMFRNWAIGRDMTLRTCDVSDLFPLPKGKDVFRCPNIIGETKKSHKLIRCNGKVYYDDNYQWCYCSKCGNKILPAELRPKPKIWEEDELVGTGYSEAEWKFANRRAARYAYFKQEAAKVGLAAKYLSVAQCTPLPDAYPCERMTEKQIRKTERKLGIKIKPRTDTDFRVTYPDELKDFGKGFYRSYGRIPARIDEGDYLDLEKLLRLNPNLAETRSKVIIGKSVIYTKDYLPETSNSDIDLDNITNSESRNEACEVDISNQHNDSSSSTDSVIRTESKSVDIAEDNNNSSAYNDDRDRRFDSDGLMIGSDERKEYYRSLEVEPPLYHMVDGKRQFKSKEAQIIWFRGNTTPAAFAETVYKKYNGDVDRMFETFERYFPDSHLEWYTPVTIPDYYKFGDDDDNVESVAVDEEGFMTLERVEQGPTVEELRAKLQANMAKQNEQRKQREQDDPKVESIPLGDIPLNTKRKLPTEFGSDIAPNPSIDKSPVINLAEVSSQEVPDWCKPSKKDDLATDGPVEIPVGDYTLESAEMDLSMSDGHTIDLDFNIRDVKNLSTFMQQKCPKIRISMDGGETYICNIDGKLFGQYLTPIVEYIAKEQKLH